MFQFSLRSLLILTTAVAIMTWVAFAPPHAAGLLVITAIYLVLVPATLAGLIYHRGYMRAFFVGLAPWATAAWIVLGIMLGNGFDDGDWRQFYNFDRDTAIQFKLMFGPQLAIAFFSGLAAVAVRWWAIKLNGRRSDREVPSDSA